MEYVLTTDNLTKQYRSFKALGGLSMHVEKGAIYGFVGRNGAGKTTLIRLICGLQTPTSGTYTLYGKKNTEGNLSRERRRMGAVVETPSIYGGMTAEDNLKEQYRVLGRPSFEGIKELLELVGLGDTGKKKAKNFSLGMKQRLGIALALVGEPDLLVLDEPINGLDPQGIAEVRDTVLKLNRERNMTILISSHILEELSKIATDYGIIHKGTLLQELTNEELMEKCSERLEVTLDDPERAVPVMDRLGIKRYQVADREHIYIFERLEESAALNMAFAKAGIPVRGISVTNEELETYFLKLTGGGANA